jgi:hypothetical protein
MKCPTCLGCFEIKYAGDIKLYYCWLCQKYYVREDGKLVEYKPKL